MSSLVKIPTENLLELRSLYKLSWPLHVVTHSTIKLFFDRFIDHPEWEDKVTFWSLNGEWLQHGTFVMVNDAHVFVNTLETAPFNDLKKLLQLLKFDRDIIFICVRDVLRPVIFDTARYHNCMIAFDTEMKCFYKEKKYFLPFDVWTPDDMLLGSLSQEHVAKVNSVWPGKFPSSEKFLETLIKYNGSMGLFRATDNELVAWCVRLDNGSVGVGQVDERFRRNAYGPIVTVAFAKAIAHFFDADFHGHTVHGNRQSEDILMNSDFEIIDCNSWIGLKKNDMKKHWSLWGHL